MNDPNPNPKPHEPLLPGATVGVLGSGQLGRMLALAARRMGYRTHTFSPDGQSPMGQVADKETVASYCDADALAEFGACVDVVTFEFENIPFDSASRLQAHCLVRPSPQVLHIAQHRAREKAFLSESGFPTVPFHLIRTRADLDQAARRIGLPAVLKTAGFGYDGKGQHRLESLEQARKLVDEYPGQEWVWEQLQDFDKEVSVLVARAVDGTMADWGVVENQHRNHILDTSVVPANVPPQAAKEAVGIAGGIARRLDLVGLLCVEFFVGKDAGIRVNEIAPRPHNSGHWTIEGSVTSQFEQQLRAVAGLALGSTQVLAPTAMANVLGELWEKGEPRWQGLLSDPFVKWHSYGKKDPRPGRKMGHLTALGSTRDEALARVKQARLALLCPAQPVEGGH